MTTAITARDKKLLYMLGIIVIVALFYIIGIRPINRKITAINKDIDDEQVEHDTIKMKLYQLDLIEDFKVNAENMVEEMSSRYYEMMSSAEADKFITNKALSYNLKVNNLSIQTGKEPVSVLAYSNSEAWKLQEQAIEAAEMDTELLSDDDIYSEKTDKDNAADKSINDNMVDIDQLASINLEGGIYNVSNTLPADVYATTMVIDVYGARDKTQAFLDDLIKNPALRVTSYQWTDMTTLPYQYVDGELVQIEQESGNRLVINVDLYMYDGTDFKKLAESEEDSSDDIPEEQSSDSIEGE